MPLKMIPCSVCVALISSMIALFANAASQPAGAPATGAPAIETVRREMSIPSQGLEVRGQRDGVGFASTAGQMARVWELSATPPPPERLGEPPEPGVAAIICPHDDYLYAGRVYRQITPLLTARTVLLVGVFHRYRLFDVRDKLVFDPYDSWRSPDGAVPVSALRGQIVGRLPAGDFIQDAAMHDGEHSLEALVYWLRHEQPAIEIIPVILPASRFGRLEELAGRLSGALADGMRKRGWVLGKDLAIAISTDGVHYGPDFKHTPFGEGGIEAYSHAVQRDMALLRGPLAGPLTGEKIRSLFETFVDPARPDEYRLTWCGRFSIPFGLMLLERTARALGQGQPVGHPVAYATSVGWPELPVRDVGLGETAPASLYHFVGYPAAAFTLGSSQPARRD